MIETTLIFNGKPRILLTSDEKADVALLTAALQNRDVIHINPTPGGFELVLGEKNVQN